MQLQRQNDLLGKTDGDARTANALQKP
jgi:hypothetical protein